MPQQTRVRNQRAQLVVNLLGQELTIQDPHGSNVISVFPKGGHARVEHHDQMVQVLIGATTVLRHRTVVGLGPEKAGVVYLVTKAVAEACPGRSDLLYPDDLKATPTGLKASRFIKLASS